MKEQSKNKGITLIALIITIIVLLILAVVVIKAVQGDGIIEHAKNARDEYVRTADEENGVIKDYADYITAQIEGSSSKDEDDEDLLRKYFLGNELTGRNVTDIIEESGENEWKFKDTDEIKNVEQLNERVEISYTENDALIETVYEYVKYKDKAYKVTVLVEEDIAQTKSLDLVYEPQGIEGQKRTYTINGKEEEWTVLYDNSKYGDSNKVVVVSNNTIGTYSLGNNDPKAQTPGDIDNDGTENTNVDKAIYSYNHAVDNLNEACRTILNANSNLSGKPIRSVGSNPNYKNVDASDFDFGADTTKETYSSSNSSYWNIEYNGIGKVTDNNAEQDYVRMCYWGVLSSDNVYWFASRVRVALPPLQVGHDWCFPFGIMCSSSFIGDGWLWDGHNSNGEDNELRACVVVDK